jgi:hypothetical protein
MARTRRLLSSLRTRFPRERSNLYARQHRTGNVRQDPADAAGEQGGTTIEARVPCHSCTNYNEECETQLEMEDPRLETDREIERKPSVANKSSLKRYTMTLFTI